MKQHLTYGTVPESTSTLLVHLCTRCDAINGHEEYLPWLYHSEQYLSSHKDRYGINMLTTAQSQLYNNWQNKLVVK